MLPSQGPRLDRLLNQVQRNTLSSQEIPRNKLKSFGRSLETFGNRKVLEVGGPYTGPQFWLVNMDARQVRVLTASNPGVSKALVDRLLATNCHKHCHVG